jgi:Magnesium-protoporphyrin IX methyltransferase C-terminus
VPISASALERRFEEHPELASWRVSRSSRIDSGFYISQAMEVEHT